MAFKLFLTFLAVHVAFLGTMVNAETTAVSLLSFGAPPIALPKLCNTQYDSIIPGCVVSDFQNGASCSAGCKAGLLQIQTNVNLACSNVKVPSNTLLGEVFSLQILAALCPNNPSTSSSTPTTAAGPQTSSTLATVTTVSITSTVSPTSIPTATPVTPSASTTIEDSTSTAISTASGLSSTELTTRTSTIPSQTGSAGSVTTSQQPQPTRLNAQQQQIVALVNSGGGSPFDIIVNSAGNAQTTAAYAVVLVGLVSFVILLAV